MPVYSVAVFDFANTNVSLRYTEETERNRRTDGQTERKDTDL